MRVVLQAESGRRAGHRIWLGANQRVFVGGTEWAEFSVPGDPQLADVQFVVESDFEHCHIRNVHPDQALYVNGIKTQTRTLVNGDIVTAGSTRFCVGIQESPEIEMRQAAICSSSLRPEEPELQYRFERCESGLLRFYAADPAQSPAEIATLLTQRYSLYLVAHLQRAALEFPPEVTRVVDLSARAEVDVAQLNPSSIVMLSPSDPIDRFALLDKSWNRDAIVGVFATGERPAVTKSFLRSNLWVYPTHVIRDQLTSGVGAFLNDLFKGIKAILIESPSPGGWDVFANPQVDPLWMQLGFPNPPASQVSFNLPTATTGAVPGRGSNRPIPGSAAGSARPGGTGSSRPNGIKHSARPDPNNARLA